MVGAGARGAPLPVLLLLLLPALLRGAAGGLADSVVWAVNAGGDAHVDVNGIHFRKDPLEGRVGRGEAGGGAAPRRRFRGGGGGVGRGRAAGPGPAPLRARRGPSVAAAFGPASCSAAPSPAAQGPSVSPRGCGAGR